MMFSHHVLLEIGHWNQRQPNEDIRNQNKQLHDGLIKM
jgi:hypothetical protein